MGTHSVSLIPGRAVNADKSVRRQMLRQAIGEMVGATFYEPMLEMARTSAFKGAYGHGGRGEDMFKAQLDAELARRAGQRENGLVETLYQRYVEKV